MTIKRHELAMAMGMGIKVLSQVPCQECGDSKSLKYGTEHRCFKCWEKHIAPKKKNFKKKKVSE